MAVAQDLITDECSNISEVWGDAIRYDHCYVDNDGYEVIDDDNRCYIYTKDLSKYTYCWDFNEALRVYFRSGRHEWMLKMINEKMDSCQFYLDQMNSPLSSQKERCEKAREAFCALRILYDCAVSPSGSHWSYISDIREKNNDFLREFRKLEDMMRYADKNN